MSWALVWGFIKKVPWYIWLILATLLTGGLFLRERRKRLRAEAKVETVTKVAERQIEHAAEVREIDVKKDAKVVALAESIQEAREPIEAEKEALVTALGDGTATDELNAILDDEGGV